MPHIPKNKKTTTQRGYGSEHQIIRAELLRLFPICQLCNDAFSEHMHHINHKPHDRRRSNLLMCCKGCHMQLHNA